MTIWMLAMVKQRRAARNKRLNEIFYAYLNYPESSKDANNMSLIHELKLAAIVEYAYKKD